MIKKLFKWLEKNSCIECEYYYKENNVCQSKKKVKQILLNYVPVR